MAERYPVAARREPSNQIDAAVQLRRHGHDPDVGRRALDFGEDVGAVEVVRLAHLPYLPHLPHPPYLPYPPPQRARPRAAQAACGLRARGIPD